jgi:hypothetical protein
MERSSKIHTASLAQFFISGVGVLAALSVMTGLAVMWIIAVMDVGISSPEAFLSVSLGWTSGVVIMLLLPSSALAFMRLISREFPQQLRTYLGLKPSILPLILLPLIWVSLLLAGEYLSHNPAIAWLFVPPLQVMVVSIPLWFWYQIARRGLSIGSHQRRWGLISFGLVVSPALILFAELLLVGFLAVVFAAWLVSQPGMVEELNRLSMRLASSQMNPEVVMRILRPYLESPGVLYSILAVVAGLIPLLEELLKPLGVWALARRLKTPGEGFIAGLLCGGMFALLENLGMLASPVTQGWAELVIGRTGTGLLHMVTSGFVGWGLVLAWRKRNYVSLVGAYMLAVFLHGLWNMTSVFMAVEMLFPDGEVGSEFLTVMGQAGPWFIGILSLVLLMMLYTANRRLNSQANRKIELFQ